MFRHKMFGIRILKQKMEGKRTLQNAPVQCSHKSTNIFQ